MTRGEFDAWKFRYASPFGLTRDDDEVMLDSWFEVFVTAGYSVTELDAARGQLHQSPPKYRNEHLEAIHRMVRDGRREAARRRAQAAGPDPSEVSACADCGETGMVAVPHPDYASGGEWQGHPLFGYRPTAAVACHCLRGRNLVSGYDAKPGDYRDRVGRPMALAEYQRRVPGWKSLLARHESGQLAALRAGAATDAADRSGGQLDVDGALAGLKRRAGLAIFEANGEGVPA